MTVSVRIYRALIWYQHCAKHCAYMNSFTLPVIPWDRYYYYSHFRDKEEGIQGAYISHSRSPTWSVPWWSQALNLVLSKLLVLLICIRPQVRWEGTYGAGIQILLVPTQQCFPVVGLASNTPIELTGAKRNLLLHQCYSWPISWENSHGSQWKSSHMLKENLDKA